MKRFFLISLVALTGASSTQAQALANLSEVYSGNTAFYRHVERGDITVEVNVWGAVRNPGLYEVPQNTPLNKLLTLSGGPPIGVTTVGGPSQVQRTLHLRLLRTGNGALHVVFDAEMKDGIFLSEQNPVVEHGDYLVVEVTERQRQRFTWRDALQVSTAVAAFALATERIVRLFP